MTDIPNVIVDLDASPEQRWTKICSQPFVGLYWNNFISILKELLPDHGVRIQKAGEALLLLFPSDFAQEITSCSAAANIPRGWMAVVNMAYELTSACTSIVAQGTDGQIYHARNLDFGMGGYLTATMRNVSAIATFIKGGKPIATETAFIGFFGTLSGQRSGKFTVTVNTRWYQAPVFKSLEDWLDEWIWALKQYPKADISGFLVRRVLQDVDSYEDAVAALTTGELISNIYFTVSGTEPGQGVVIERNRTGAHNVWPLWSSGNKTGAGSWYVLITNYDHEKGAPWIDDRMDAGYAAMDAMGQKDLSLQGLLNVLSTKPVFNLLTSYSLLAVNSNSTYVSYNRACPFPCAL